MARWESLRAHLMKKIPVGIYLAPFEFGVAVTWLAYGIRLLIDNFKPGADALRAALPLTGAEFTAWSFLLPISSALMVLGLVCTVVWPVAGLYIERTGLLGMSVTLTTFVYALVSHAHVSLLSLTSINLGATLLMVVLRFLIVGATLDTLRKRLDAEREAH